MSLSWPAGPSPTPRLRRNHLRTGECNGTAHQRGDEPPFLLPQHSAVRPEAVLHVPRLAHDPALFGGRHMVGLRATRASHTRTGTTSNKNF